MPIPVDPSITLWAKTVFHHTIKQIIMICYAVIIQNHPATHSPFQYMRVNARTTNCYRWYDLNNESRFEYINPTCSTWSSEESWWNMYAVSTTTLSFGRRESRYTDETVLGSPKSIDSWYHDHCEESLGSPLNRRMGGASGYPGLYPPPAGVIGVPSIHFTSQQCIWLIGKFRCDIIDCQDATHPQNCAWDATGTSYFVQEDTRCMLWRLWYNPLLHHHLPHHCRRNSIMPCATLPIWIAFCRTSKVIIRPHPKI